jgi:cytochrome P450
VAAAARDHRRLGSHAGTEIASRRAEGEGQHSIHNMDEPDHGKMRSVIAGQFTRRAVLRLLPRIQEISEALLDEMVDRRECDFVEQAASKLPLLIVAELLGVPREDAPLLFDWTNQFVSLDPEIDNADRRAGARQELSGYFRALAQERRRSGADDVVTALVRASLGDRSLTDEELDPYFILLVVAGNETTRNLMSGGLWGLASTAGAFDQLRNSPNQLDTAVEEMLRWVSPVINMRRTALCDLEWHETRISAGDKVVLWFGSANRDERVFDEPDTFKVDRHPNDHLACGWGNHFCLGAHLARLEVKTFFAEVLRRGLDIYVTTPPVRVMSNWFRGIRTLPVQVTQTVTV